MSNLILFGFLTGVIVGYGIWRLSRGRVDPLAPWAINVRAETALFVAGLAIAITILMISFLSSSWGQPSSPYWPLTRMLDEAPVAPLLLGVLVGGLGAEWLRFIIVPPRITSSELNTAHTRWGYILGGILIVAGLLPAMPDLSRRLGSANVTTPIGSVAFTTKQESEVPRGGLGSNDRSFIQTNLAKPPLPLEIEVSLQRAGDYEGFFLREDADRRKALDQLRTANQQFVQALDAVQKCIRAHFGIFHSPQMLLDPIRPTFTIYLDLMRKKEKSTYTADGLVNVLRETTKNLAADIASVFDNKSDNKSPCETGIIVLDSKKDISLEFSLPYSSMGLAYLFYAVGAHKSAGFEIDRWIREQYRGCNLDQKNCGYESGKGRELLPYWYKIQAEYALSLIMESTGPARKRRDVFNDGLKTLNSLFNRINIKSVAEWTQKCTAGARNLSPDQLRLEERLVAVEVGQANKLLYYTVADIRRETSDEVLATDDLVALAKRNTEIDLNCFLDVWRVPQESLRADFLLQHGAILKESVVRAVRAGQNSETVRTEQRELLTLSRKSLARAVNLIDDSVIQKVRDLDKDARVAAQELFPETELYYEPEALKIRRDAKLQLEEVLGLLRSY